MSVGTSAENFAGAFFLCNRKFQGIPYYIKGTNVALGNSYEDIDCRERPHEARECAKAHFFYLTADSQKAGKMYRQYSGNRGIIPPFISYLVQKEIPAAG